MNFCRSRILKTLSIAFAASVVSSHALAEMSLKNAEIKNCSANQKTCFKVTAPTASVGSIRPLYVLNDLTLTLEGAKGQKEVISSPLGYLDFDNNQLVLQEKNAKGELVERVINLQTFERKTYTTK